MKPEIRKMMVCSTAHLPETVATKFSEETYCPDGIVYQNVEYGYLIRYFQSKDMADRRLWPTTLRKVVEIAERNDCSMILFDCDGLTLDGVQTFDW